MIFVYLLVWILPLTRHPLWGENLGEMTMIKYVGGACVLYSAVYLFVRSTRPGFLKTRAAWAFFAFYFVAVLSYFTRGPQFSLDNNPFISYTSFVLFFFVTLTVTDSMARLRSLVLVAVGSVGWASLYILREWQKYGATTRPGWVVGDANYFTASALLCLPLAFYYASDRRAPLWVRVCCLGAMVDSLLAVMLGGSRGGFLGLGVVALVIILRSRHRTRHLIELSAVILGFSLLSPMSPLKRLMNPTVIDTRSSDSRLEVWAAGLRMFSENPAFGVGLGNFKSRVHRMTGEGTGRLADGEQAHVAHNTYIEILAETGLPGFAAFVAMIVLGFRSLGRVAKSSRDLGPEIVYRTALGLQAGLAGFLTSGFFVSAQYQKLFWLMLFLAMSLPSLVQQHRRRIARAEGIEANEGSREGQTFPVGLGSRRSRPAGALGRVAGTRGPEWAGTRGRR